MSIVQKKISVPAEGSGFKSPLGFALPQPKLRIIPKKLVKLCYTLVHACETLEIRDLTDGEFRPVDTTLAISRGAYDHIKNKLKLGYKFIGEQIILNTKACSANLYSTHYWQNK
jgi:hypothetical protein